MDVIIPNLVHVLFDPAIPTSSFNLFNYFLYLLLFFFIALWAIHVFQHYLAWFARSMLEFTVNG